MDKTRAVYGIDLGTTYSCIAQVDQFDQAVVLRNFEGDSITPSVVYFEDENNVMVGKDAKDMLNSEPEKAVSFIKREMGNDAAFDKSANNTPTTSTPPKYQLSYSRNLLRTPMTPMATPNPSRTLL